MDLCSETRSVRILAGRIESLSDDKAVFVVPIWTVISSKDRTLLFGDPDKKVP